MYDLHILYLLNKICLNQASSSANSEDPQIKCRMLHFISACTICKLKGKIDLQRKKSYSYIFGKYIICDPEYI